MQRAPVISYSSDGFEIATSWGFTQRDLDKAKDYHTKNGKIKAVYTSPIYFGDRILQVHSFDTLSYAKIGQADRKGRFYTKLYAFGMSPRGLAEELVEALGLESNSIKEGFDDPSVDSTKRALSALHESNLRLVKIIENANREDGLDTSREGIMKSFLEAEIISDRGGSEE